MITTTTVDTEQAIAKRASLLDAAALHKTYWDQDEFIVVDKYVANVHMNPFMRFVSNMKDSIAYFGLKEVFFGRKRS